MNEYVKERLRFLLKYIDDALEDEDRDTQLVLEEVEKQLGNMLHSIN